MEMYKDHGVLFCRSCCRSLEFMQIRRYHQGQIQVRTRKEEKEAVSSSRARELKQYSLATVVKSKDLRKSYF